MRQLSQDVQTKPLEACLPNLWWQHSTSDDLQCLWSWHVIYKKGPEGSPSYSIFVTQMWPQEVSNQCTFPPMLEMTLRKLLPGISGQMFDETGKLWLLSSGAFRERSWSIWENMKINQQEAKEGTVTSYIDSGAQQDEERLPLLDWQEAQPMRDCHSPGNEMPLHL